MKRRGDDIVRALRSAVEPGRLRLDPERTASGLARLVLTLVRLLHELLEREAIRRIDGGSLDDEQTEKLGLTLMRQAQEIDRLRRVFGLKESDLNLDLGPLGSLFESRPDSSVLGTRDSGLAAQGSGLRTQDSGR